MWQLRTVDLESPQSCNQKFVSNQWLGLLVFLGIVFGRVATTADHDENDCDGNGCTADLRHTSNT